ncbi:hypothetical protein FSP39_020808 [Pinctada imbricata]|uniref:BTB domain-containing protein n=1 Tax=Pinctada imbricata TaxID=66713 RepID=A0AA88XI28_PINIB|nr:hypothetical protein FSP39_020808 [Pinctada imbricata]
MGTTYDWQTNKNIIECNRHMLANDVACDVGFRVGPDHVFIGAHKYVLISRSCVFYAMFQGLMANHSKERISIPDINSDTFKQMLEYIYCEDTKVEAKNALPLLYAARKYCLAGLESKCVRVMQHGITVDNVCHMYKQADKFDELELKKKCLEFIIHHSKDILKSVSFTELPFHLVKEIVKSDELECKEDVICDAVLRWSEMECLRNEVIVCAQNQRYFLGGILYYLRLPLLDEHYFNKIIIKADILSPEESRNLRKYFNGVDTEVKRFKTSKRTAGDNLTLNWRFGPVSCIHNEETAISFTASHDVLVEGVQIDGSGYEEDQYDVTIHILDIENRDLAKTRQRIHISKKQKIHKVVFPAAPKVDKGYKYIVMVKVQGQHNYYGASGRSHLHLQSQTPTMINPEGDFSRTVTKKDQVPAILVKPYIYS